VSDFWITSDTHFGHKSIFSDSKCPNRQKWCGSTIEEHDSSLIKIWNSQVKPDDVVLHLGDFAWGNPARQKAYREVLNGSIWIVLGNHDSLSMTAYRTRVFRPTDIVEKWFQFEYKGKKILCKHVPYEFTENEIEKFDELWHGHVHDRPYTPPTPKHIPWGVDRQEGLLTNLGSKEDNVF
jgi:calcineurin-like phosphoesterase family protein